MRNRGLWRTAICFTGAFLLCGALRVLTYHKDLFEGFSPLFCGRLLLFWAVRCWSRIPSWRSALTLLLWTVLVHCFPQIYFLCYRRLAALAGMS